MTSCGRKRFPPWRALTLIWMKPAHRGVSIREEIRPMEKRVKEIDRLLFHIGNFEANKPVYTNMPLSAGRNPRRNMPPTIRRNWTPTTLPCGISRFTLMGRSTAQRSWPGEQAQLSENIASKTEALTAVQEDVKILRDVGHWLNQVLPSEQYRQTAEPGRNRPSSRQSKAGSSVSGGTGRETPAAPPPAKTGYGNLTNQALAIFP